MSWITKKRFTAILVLALVLVIGGISAWPDKAWYNNSSALYDLQLEPIQYATNFGDTVAAEFGTLTVPENRSTDSSNIIRLAFVRFKSLANSPGPPIFYLQGGPGSPGIPRAKGELFRFFMTLRHHGDVILIDQRGVGESQPNLDCDMTLGLDTDTQRGIQANLVSTISQRFSECAEYLRDKGVDIAAYNTNENADDLDDIRKALQYDSVALLGYSYGTELAQVYIRRHESKVAKAILIGPVAPDQAYKLPSDIQNYFTRLDSMIAADPRHRKIMPSLVSTMKLVHDSLKQQSEFLQIPLLDAVGDDAGIGIYFYKTIAFFKPNWEMHLGNTHLEIMVANNIESRVWTRRFPQFYYELQNKDYQTVGNWLRNFRRRNIGNAMSHAMIGATSCNEQRRVQAMKESDSAILSDFGISTVRQKEIGKSWGNLDLGDQYREPVSSDVRVLFIAGTLDGVTPISNAQTLQNRFPNSTLITITNAAHDELIETGSIHEIKRFLANLDIENSNTQRPFFFFRSRLMNILSKIHCIR